MEVGLLPKASDGGCALKETSLEPERRTREEAEEERRCVL